MNKILVLFFISVIQILSSKPIEYSQIFQSSSSSNNNNSNIKQNDLVLSINGNCNYKVGFKF